LEFFCVENHLKCPYAEFVNPMLLQMPTKFVLKQILQEVHMFHQLPNNKPCLRAMHASITLTLDLKHPRVTHWFFSCG
jgi:hypothetical protein